MNSNRQPKGIPAGGEFAAHLRAEPKLFIGIKQATKPVQGQLARAGDQDLSEAEARKLWTEAKGRINVQDGAYEQMAFNAGQNLAQHPVTPAAVLHDMVVKRDKAGQQSTRGYFMEKLPMKDALQAVINNPNTSAETLFVIARSSGHEGHSDAAKRRLKEMRHGASLRERYRLFTEWRKATRKGTPGK